MDTSRIALVDRSLDGSTFILHLFDSTAMAYRPRVFKTDTREGMESMLGYLGTYLSMHCKVTEELIKGESESE